MPRRITKYHLDNHNFGNMKKKFKTGGFSIEGFKYDSPDKDNSVNYINSSDITMKGVPHPVLGVDNTGASSMMYPGRDYKFPGQVVKEIPVRYQQGGTYSGVTPSIYLPGPVKQVVDNSTTAPMDNYGMKYPNINRLSTIQDSLSTEAQNHIDNKQYFGENTIKLNNGNFRGANVDTQLLDDIVASAKRKGVDPYTMLGVAGQETALGSHGYNNTDQNQVMSGWNVAEKYKPEYNTLFLADHRVPGVNVVRDNTGMGANITNADSTESYLRQHPQLIDTYRNTQGAKIPQGKVPLMDLTADYIKQKGIAGYNPGDPDYANKVNKRIQELKTDPTMKKYMSGKKMQQGGGVSALGNMLKGFQDYGDMYDAGDKEGLRYYPRDNNYPPQYQQPSPVAGNTNAGYSPTPKGMSRPQQDNWHTGEDTDYSIDSVRQQQGLAKLGGPFFATNNDPNYVNPQVRPHEFMRTQNGMMGAELGGYLSYQNTYAPMPNYQNGGGVQFIDDTRNEERPGQPRKGGSTMNGTSWSKFGGYLPEPMEYAYLANGGVVDRYGTGGMSYQEGGMAEEMKDGGSIKIKPENKGKFTAYKKRTGKTTEEALHSSDPHVRQMANFARNSKSWSKKEYGGLQKFMQDGGYNPATDPNNPVTAAYANEPQVDNNNQPMVSPTTPSTQPMVQNAPMTTSQSGPGGSSHRGNNGLGFANHEFDNLLGAGLVTASYFNDQKNQRQLHQFTQNQGLSDNTFGAQRLNTQGNRGDYTPNTGTFRPSDNTPSAPGMYYAPQGRYGGYMQNGGGVSMGAQEVDLPDHEIIRLKSMGYKVEYL